MTPTIEHLSGFRRRLSLYNNNKNVQSHRKPKRLDHFTRPSLDIASAERSLVLIFWLCAQFALGWIKTLTHFLYFTCENFDFYYYYFRLFDSLQVYVMSVCLFYLHIYMNRRKLKFKVFKGSVLIKFCYPAILLEATKLRNFFFVCFDLFSCQIWRQGWRYPAGPRWTGQTSGENRHQTWRKRQVGHPLS